MSLECELAVPRTAEAARLVIRDRTLTVMAEECGWPRCVLDAFTATKQNPFSSTMYDLMTTDVMTEHV